MKKSPHPSLWTEQQLCYLVKSEGPVSFLPARHNRLIYLS